VSSLLRDLVVALVLGLISLIIFTVSGAVLVELVLAIWPSIGTCR
jgi:hypothetical protein